MNTSRIMKSSKNKKSEVDDISRETQRLVSGSHVHLPYHKPKQKSLKDFLNRQKISKECQVSITGSKKLLQKAWELIESKEKTVEKFYNEDCSQDKNDAELSSISDNFQDEKNTSVNNDDNNYCDEDLILSKEHKNTSEDCDDENNSITESEISATNISPLIDDTDYNSDLDEEDDENLKHKLNYESSENHNDSSNDEDGLKKSVAKQFIDDEAQSESDCSSENEENIPNFIDESDDEEAISYIKKRKVIALSDSDDENEIINDDSSNIDSKLISDGLYETETNICTQQLMGLCSGQFQTQGSEAEENDEDFEDDFDSDVPQNHTISTNNDFDEMPKLTSVKDLIKNNEDDLDSSQNNFEGIENNDFDELAKITSVKDVFHNETDDSDDSEINAEKNENYYNGDMPKPTSAKDFFDDEAELSESDWSSDDEENLIDTIDKLEEEEGDKDKLDESIIKDGLDKIYMRQLLDDDQQQVTALKEMLLEDGDLHSDSNRKRKFQWDETNQDDAVFKKPLFSDNEDDDADDVLSEDEKSGNWRKERFKRESFLSQQDDEEYDHSEEESSDILQTSVSFVKKTHVVKYQKDHSKKKSNKKCDEDNELNSEIIDGNEKNTSTLITVVTDILEVNKIKNSDLSEPQVTNISSKLNKIVKGSFMKHNNNNKMTNTLLYINTKSIIGIDEKKNTNYEDKSEIKSMNTITAKASSNPFAYLLRNDNKQEITNTNVEKKENVTYPSKPVQSTSIESTQQIHQTTIRKPMTSILKQLE